jgi:hypothetical protein
MRGAILALLSLSAVSAKSEGLSWTEANLDKLCRNGTLQMLTCSKAFLYQLEPIIIGAYKEYDLNVMVILYPAMVEGEDLGLLRKRMADAVKVYIKIVLETADHVKRTYAETVRIEVDTKGKVPVRSGTMMVTVPEVGIISVLAVDATEENSKGEALSRHVFR